MLIDDGKPLVLRDYQTQCAAECESRNVLCALPVGSGKTVIAAEVIQRFLQKETEKKVIFLAPYGQLALQQYKLLLRQIDRLHDGCDTTTKVDASEAELARWRVGLVAGRSTVDEQYTMPWRRAVRECQVLVMTPALCEKALIHAGLRMTDLALLVIDEAHNARGNAMPYTIMHYFYFPRRQQPGESRPRILALTACPVHQPDDTHDQMGVVRDQLDELEAAIDARVWSCEIEEAEVAQVPAERAPARAFDRIPACTR